MTTFYSFTLKTETSWAKKVVKHILQTWNTNDVSVYVWFIHSRTKNFKKHVNVKKNNLKYTKFTIKN